MKIVEARAWKTDLALKKPYTIAYKTTDTVENAFVQLVLEDGTTGIGAANPSQYVVGESLDDTMSVLQGGILDELKGRNIFELGGILAEQEIAIPSNPGARAAMDIALFDAFTSHLGVPIVTFLGPQVSKMATSVTIGILNVEETLKEAQEYLGLGFQILKIKLGNNVDEDVERLVKLREAHGSAVKIRIDANQGYSRDDLRSFFEMTRSLDIELNEQPLKADDIEGMKNLPDEIKRTLAADESLVTPEDAMRLAEAPTASGIFNIKLMKCGGIYSARKIATVAELSGIELMWGCNDESIVSIAAGLHVAFSSRNTKYIDLDGSFDLAKDVVEGGFVLENGLMRPNGQPGLGVKLLEG